MEVDSGAGLSILSEPVYRRFWSHQPFYDRFGTAYMATAGFLCDIIITGRNVQGHDQRVQKVLERVAQSGLRLNGKKCVFAVQALDFLGFHIDAHGIRPCQDKVAAAREPRNKKDLQAFLGLINFYERFLKNKVTLLEPLHRPLEKEARWDWTEAHRDAFQSINRALSTELLLARYDVDKPVVLVCDASPCGVRAVISSVDEKGEEVPIAFRSQTMHASARNYAQVDREPLRIIYEVTKFRQYAYRWCFVIYTDHIRTVLCDLYGPQTLARYFRPLLTFSLSPRMLRWTLTSNRSYNYELRHWKGADMANADVLSRLLVDAQAARAADPDLPEVLSLKAIPDASAGTEVGLKRSHNTITV